MQSPDRPTFDREDINISPKIKRQILPPDLPRSLDDRRPTQHLPLEEEVYDAWQGQSQYITAPLPRLNFHLNDSPTHGFDSLEDDLGISLSPLPINSSLQTAAREAETEARLSSMLDQQAAIRKTLDDVNSLDKSVEDVVKDGRLTEAEKRNICQKMLAMAASNGDTKEVRHVLEGAGEWVDVNKPDEDGTSPLIYASCFGHEDVVTVLLQHGANVDQQDRNQWSSLMWAMTNKHRGIAKILLDHGASPDVRSTSGRTVFDFAEPDSEMSDYLKNSGYIGTAGIATGGWDTYDMGLADERFEQELQENEFKRRMAMESSFNLEVDLASLGLDEAQETVEEEELDSEQEFVWDRCLIDQMFVFQETELNKLLDIIITNMLPQRSHSQKPVPANVLFLSARYAHYHATNELLEQLLHMAMEKINKVVEKHQWDMTMLAFWLSNATILLYYLRKDTGLGTATIEFQQRLSELINEIFTLIVRDAQRRMDKVLDAAVLDHETIPGFEDVHFQNEWRLFKSKKKAPEEPPEKRYRPPTPKERAKPAPRNITSLLSSTLFVLDLYDIHSVITSQIISQLFYWLGAELFNRIMSNRRYLARTKAMQIRLNVSQLEDWARSNNRQPEHYESGSLHSSGECVADAAKRHLEPVIQLLQWLQCFSSMGEDLDALKGTIDQLPRLTPQQLVHATKNYRSEVGEKGLSRDNMKYLVGLHMDQFIKKNAKKYPSSVPTTPLSPVPLKTPTTSKPPDLLTPDGPEEEDAPENLLMDSNMSLPFTLPTSTDMLVSFGAGLGGTNRERERKYWPNIPQEYISKLDFSGGGGNYGEWS
ncbi:hypothetical protein BJ508DRAFT_414941 [Ascobolus immersus RN42]|uniref:Dilute domain-containing protein n=1 Tax=Ascobolus immersus RN42 TaxID=1160509 RepID=A0A3N4I8W0_ASCIM|nr:hypothetical protein BJ508DRAFT_414941 [Ascobolus immersus RN42]